MTGQFTEKDPVRCNHYARFFKNLTATEANLIYWISFVIVITLMCIASLQHHKSNALTEYNKKLPKHVTSTERFQIKTRRTRLRFLGVASTCLVISATITVFECFAMFNIEFCAGEDLMPLYWVFWSVLQLGSNIAILGVMVQFWIVLGDIETPSWAVALGTPVLVFAAIGFAFRHVYKQTLGRLGSKKVAISDEEQARGWQDDKQRDDVVGPRDSGKFVAEQREDRNLSTAATIIPTATNATHTRDSSLASNFSVSPPQIIQINVGRQSTFWQRDLRQILNFVVAGEDAHGSDEDREIERRAYGRGHGGHRHPPRAHSMMI